MGETRAPRAPEMPHSRLPTPSLLLVALTVTEARRGAFLSTSGSFKLSSQSNRGGNTERGELGSPLYMIDAEPSTLDNAPHLGEVNKQADAKRDAKSARVKELVEKADSANKAVLKALEEEKQAAGDAVAEP